MRALNLRLVARVLAVITAVMIAFMSLTPVSDAAAGRFSLIEEIAKLIFDDRAQADKIGHFLAYTALGALAAFGVRLFGEVLVIFGFLALGLVAYGGFLEIAQGFVPERSRSFADLLANTLGVFVGFVLAECAHLLVRRFHL